MNAVLKTKHQAKAQYSHWLLYICIHVLGECTASRVDPLCTRYLIELYISSLSPSLLFADPPISPRGLDLVIIRSPTPTLRLVWERPLNVDPQVDIVYTVEINSTLPDGINYGPFENISQTYLPIDFPEALHSNRSCQMYWFFVSARNGAGPSLPSSYIETLPISKSLMYMS